MKTKTQTELQIEFNLRNKIKRLNLQVKSQKDLGNLGRADLLSKEIERLNKKLI
tara:strand:- start:4480 stop:4641 length:162 start_codon:yes stop_codon:yes gene_type:complete